MLRGKLISQQHLVTAGGAMHLAQVQALLNVSRQRIGQLVAADHLLAIPDPCNRPGYPAIEFRDDGSVVPGLSLVLAAVPTKNL
jgi:D-mannonate dehydratase